LKQHQLESEIDQKPAGPQGNISSRTTVKEWLGMNPAYNISRWGQPIGFGCSICQALRFETLEEAVEHRRVENKTVRSRYWMHDVTLVAQQTVYVAEASAIKAAAEKQGAQ
jgi:NACalpha-BTF3-like transcription factor